MARAFPHWTILPGPIWFSFLVLLLSFIFKYMYACVLCRSTRMCVQSPKEPRRENHISWHPWSCSHRQLSHQTDMGAGQPMQVLWKSHDLFRCPGFPKLKHSWGWGDPYLVECLPSMCKALDLIPQHDSTVDHTWKPGTQELEAGRSEV